VLGHAIHRLDTVDSTQLACKRLASAGAPEGTVVTAAHQEHGRGRLGRSWWDARGQSLLISVLLRPRVLPARAAQISLVAGLAVTDALAAVACVAADLRWPNDVLVNGRKLCGILTEAAVGQDGRLEHVIVGIGINLDQTAFPAALEDRATSLRLLTGAAVDHDAVFRAVLGALDARYAQWLAAGFGTLRDAWRARSSTIGAWVSVPGGVEGTAIDVDGDGALIVASPDGHRSRVVSGELADGPASDTATGVGSCCS
jgi:BirA family biotin operon repressor/biotin-[acetyl-CoA-carboxylase] ligase